MTTKAEELREALDGITTYCRGVFVGDAEDVCAIICDELGVTREMVAHLDMILPNEITGNRITIENQTVGALRAILDVAGR